MDAHMGPYIPIYPYIYLYIPIFTRKCQKNDFSELSLPGVEIVPTPCASILRTTTASHLPYNAKIKNMSKLCILLIFQIRDL